MSEKAKRARQTGTRGVPKPSKAANGYWYATWSDGRRSRRTSLGTQDETQALKTFAQWVLIEGWNKGGSPGAEARVYTIADLWSVYMDKHVKPNVVGQATIGYAWQNLEPHFGPLSVDQITQGAVDQFIAKRASGRLGRPAKPITIRRELATLIAALNFCTTSAGNKLIGKADIETIRMPHPGEPRDRWLRMDEMQRLLKAAGEARRGDRLSRGERFLWLALETAARKQAILDLTWSRVDFEIGVIHYDVPGREKTKKRRASVPISSALRPVLERAFAEREGDLVMDNKAEVWATVQFIAMRAGFSTQTVAKGEKPRATGISPHVLRHTAATHMARRGVPLWVIAKILGNTLAMVERVYAKWMPDDPAGTVDLISGGVLETTE